MNRRRFFNFLGAATLGTIVALKLPDTIAPIKLWIEKPKITFQALLEAYDDARNKGGVSPFKIILNPEDYKDALSLMKGYVSTDVFNHPFSEKFMFMDAEISPSNKGIHGKMVDLFGFGEVEQGTIETVGKTYGCCGRYKFI